jgi:hypothetical protein
VFGRSLKPRDGHDAFNRTLELRLTP